jgi:hypothetical protein
MSLGEHIHNLRQKIETQQEQINALEELIFLRVLYHDCIHKHGVMCKNTGLEDTRCSKDNCPLFDNPHDI